MGHRGRFGHEFLEFEFRPDGLLRYANNSNYKRDSLIRKELIVSAAVMQLIKGLVEGSAVMQADDSKWPASAPLFTQNTGNDKGGATVDRNPLDPDVAVKESVGRQELEVIWRGAHINFATAKFGSLSQLEEICSSGNSVADGRGGQSLKEFYYLVQDLKTLVFALIAAHFKIKPV